MVNSVQGLNFLLRVKHPSVRLSRQKYEIIPNHFPHYKAARSDPSPSPAITPLPHRTSQTFKPLQQQDRQRLPFFSVSVGQVAVTGLLEKFLLAVRLRDLGNDTHPTEKMSCELWFRHPFHTHEAHQSCHSQRARQARNKFREEAEHRVFWALLSVFF